MTSNIAHRAVGVRALFDTAGIDALLISDLVNVRWLTGFTGSNGWLVVHPDHLTLVTDGRYGDQAARQLAEAEVDAEVVVGATGAQLVEAINRVTEHHRAVGFESAHVSVAQHASWAATFTTALCPVVGLVEAGRRAKDADEVRAIQRACSIADQALAEVAPEIGTALRTEASVRNQLEIRMRELGASGPSYETIVASGPTNAALPHHRPTETRIEPGHTVVIDVGALVDGYHSDMTRTFVVGEPTGLQSELYQLVLDAQVAGVDAVRPGISSAELDAVCRSTIAAAGYGDWFSHGTGHGVGLLIHEDPFINAAGGFTLQVGDVVTVEPGVYRDGFGGIRVEDLVQVTSDGCRVLTASPKDSPCLPSPPTT